MVFKATKWGKRLRVTHAYTHTCTHTVSILSVGHSKVYSLKKEYTRRVEEVKEQRRKKCKKNMTSRN